MKKARIKEEKDKVTVVLEEEKEPRVIKTIDIDDKKYCTDFEKDGVFCKYYTGSNKYISSCYSNCRLEKKEGENT